MKMKIRKKVNNMKYMIEVKRKKWKYMNKSLCRNNNKQWCSGGK